MVNFSDIKGYFSEQLPVPAGWEDVFPYFYYAANSTGEPLAFQLMPNFQTILVFSFGEPVQFKLDDDVIIIKQSIVLGPLKKLLDYTLPSGSEILVVNFRFDAFFRFFGSSLTAYEERPKHPDELLGTHCFADLWHELKGLPSNKQRVERILQFSAVYLKGRNPAADYIIRDGFPADNRNPVKVIANECGQSERNVQLNFKKYLGYSAKEISRYERFRLAVIIARDTYSQSGIVDWFEVIDKCGYYDQPHLIHDFKHYLGISPARFLQLQAALCIAGR
jgi:AraC-like DNA-binding protein